MREPSGYVLEPRWEGADFTLHRGRQQGNASPVLGVAGGLSPVGAGPHPDARQIDAGH